jgi:hypothetical protein
MRNGGIDSDDQIEIGGRSGGFGEICERVREIDDPAGLRQ